MLGLHYAVKPKTLLRSLSNRLCKAFSVGHKLKWNISYYVSQYEKKIVNTRNRYSYFIYPCPSIYALMRSINVHQSPFRFPRNHQGTLCHLAWPPGCNRFVSQIGKMRNLAQVCGAVSKAEEEELCLKQLELVSSKLSQPGVTVGTMSDCMVCKYSNC